MKIKKVLLLNPNRWGRGITSIWIPSHTATLKLAGLIVELFDASFYQDWSFNELEFNTQNNQYKSTDYSLLVNFSNEPVRLALQEKINIFKPDLIFWSAISSHIHGEGEYVNVQYGYDLLKLIDTDALFVTGGLQVTATPKKILSAFPEIDILIRGYSEITLLEVINCLNDESNLSDVPNIFYHSNNDYCITPAISNFSFEKIPAYDYSVFDDIVFLRPYNGNIVRAVDYELSRGCIYSCSYCVETIIQNYYGFKEITSSGTIRKASQYINTKASKRIFEELSVIHKTYGVTFFRCQDTNFLTMDRGVLHELADLFDECKLDIYLYIETRPEGINENSIRLLRRLKVDGIGMGVEISNEKARNNNLNRFVSTEKIVKAFDMLKLAGIKRTAYNIIGLPGEDEESILETIKFNSRLDPDNITVAFYSPYIGTLEQLKSSEVGMFIDYEFDVDGQLRTLTRSTEIHSDLLNFYKRNFTKLVREGLGILPNLKKNEL